MTKVCSIWIPYQVKCAKRLLCLYDSMELNKLKKNWVIEDETWVTFTPQPWQSDSKFWHKVVVLINSVKKTMVLHSFINDGKFFLHGTQLYHAIRRN